MRRQGRQDQGAAGRPVRHRPAPRAVGRVGRGHGEGADDPRPRVLRRGRRGGRRRRPRGRGGPGLRRGAHRVRHLPQLPRRAAAPVHQHGRGGGQPRRRLRRLRRHPRDQRVGAARRPRPGPRGAVRPPRQRDAHRAAVAGRRRGRRHHRGRADRRHGHRGRAARRGPPDLRHRPVGRAAGPGEGGRCRPGRRRLGGRLAARGPGRARHGRGLRHRARDVRVAAWRSRRCSPT